jgi:TonB family protein
MMLWRTLLIPALGVSSAVAVSGPPILQPTGKWTVNFAEDQCLASRAFQVPEGDLILALRPSPTANEAELILALSRPVDKRLFSGVQIRLDGQRVGSNGLISMPDSEGRLAYRIYLEPAEYSQLLISKTLTIQGGVGNFGFDLASIDAVRRSLEECNSDLLARWGLSREDQSRQVSFPKPANRVKFLFTDYPKGARKGAVGLVQARLSVAADGSINNCSIVRSSGDAVLDQATCSIFVRRVKKMEPARDKIGQPMASLYVFSRLWSVPVP